MRFSFCRAAEQTNTHGLHNSGKYIGNCAKVLISLSFQTVSYISPSFSSLKIQNVPLGADKYHIEFICRRVIEPQRFRTAPVDMFHSHISTT